MLTSDVERNLSKLNQDCTGLVQCRQILFRQKLRDAQSGVAGSIALMKIRNNFDEDRSFDLYMIRSLRRVTQNQEKSKSQKEVISFFDFSFYFRMYFLPFLVWDLLLIKPPPHCVV